MAKVKITVLKKTLNKELAEKYCQPGASICTSFEEGQEFVVDGLAQPENFCAWAWDDIHKVLLALWSGGSFHPWMKEKNNIIACCTDGIRPVFFNVERLAD